MSTAPERPASRPYVRIGRRKIPIPRSRIARIATGAGFVLGGTLGFLPILGFWMIPVGLIILAHDFPAARRAERVIRKVFVRLWRRWIKPKGGQTAR